MTFFVCVLLITSDIEVEPISQYWSNAFSQTDLFLEWFLVTRTGVHKQDTTVPILVQYLNSGAMRFHRPNCF